MSSETLYESITTASDFLLKQKLGKIKVGVILGSGLGAFAQTLEEKTVIPYDSIPGFAATRVKGHEGKLVFGKLSCGVPILIMQGRVHYYEGHSISQVVFPARVLANIGIKTLVITNASGGITPRFVPGSLVLIADHINLMGTHPLLGPNEEKLGTRFPDMSQAYPESLRNLARQVAKEQKLDLQEGVYAAMSGPSYETPAEVKMLRTLGADMVGMSTVPEVIASVHMGVKILGISCITNLAAGVSDVPIEHSHVEIVASQARQTFTRLLEGILPKLAS